MDDSDWNDAAISDGGDGAPQGEGVPSSEVPSEFLAEPSMPPPPLPDPLTAADPAVELQVPVGADGTVVAGRRRVWPWLVVVAVVGAGGGFAAGRFLAPAVTDDIRIKVAAEEFCALGDEDGASLFDVSGWVTAAQRVNDDWSAVITEIDKHCPFWRQQVIARSNDVGN